ncbi:MAG: DUF3192 domain-containing protein [Litorilituus sp.]|nr:DUF3192 domain-containing protein [Litorilituus sp.]
MKKTIIALVVAAPLTLSGCVISVGDDGVEHSTGFNHEDRSYKNRKQLNSLQLGASIVDIQEKLNVADFSEMYSVNNDTVRVLYYRTQRKHKDGLTTKDECTYLEFINGALVQIGHGGGYNKITAK